MPNFIVADKTLLPALRETFPEREFLNFSGTIVEANGTGLRFRWALIVGWGGPGDAMLMRTLEEVRKGPPELLSTIRHWRAEVVSARGLDALVREALIEIDAADKAAEKSRKGGVAE